MHSKLTVIAPVFLLCLLVCCNDRPNDKKKQATGKEMQDTIKSRFKGLVNEVWNKGNMGLLNDISADNYIRKINGITVADTRKDVQANLGVFLTGFPDSKVTVDKTILEGRQLVVHWNFTGTHMGIFGELRPTGKKAKISGCTILEFNQIGKIQREEVHYNELDLVQQLGYTLIPPVLE